MLVCVIYSFCREMWRETSAAASDQVVGAYYWGNTRLGRGHKDTLQSDAVLWGTVHQGCRETVFAILD